MAYYRKKPITIQAVRFLKQNVDLSKVFNETPTWLLDTLKSGKVIQAIANKNLAIQTKEGFLFATPGSWIIRGVKGEIYPIDDEIFRETYDFVSLTKPEELEEEEG